jgi:hypothetical protein
MGHRYEVRELDERDHDAVERWTQQFCGATPLAVIQAQYGKIDDRRQIARRIARTFPKATQEAAFRGAISGFGLDGP